MFIFRLSIPVLMVFLHGVVFLGVLPVMWFVVVIHVPFPSLYVLVCLVCTVCVCVCVCLCVCVFAHVSAV